MGMAGGAGVVVVGSLHHDIMVAAPHRPAAGETVAGTAWHRKFGGKGGNQAVAAARAGAPVRMLGAVGDDAFGAFLRERLRAGGVDDALVATLAGAGSGISVAISDPSGDYGAVIVSGANLLIDPGPLASAAFWQGAAVLMLQNEVSEELNLAAATAARARGVRVCLNAAPARPLGLLAKVVDLLVVNAGEAEALSGLPVADLDGAARAAERLVEEVPVAVVTAGGRGVAAAGRAEAPFARPAEPVAVVSAHGAGDAFAGTLCAALARGASLAEAVGQANGAAARHVAGLGAPPSP
jgi:ribokinase